jgi:hypothetical protein
MNERIRELFDRAEHQAQKQSGSDWEVYVEPSREQIFEKFAELIVRECLEIAIEEERHAPFEGPVETKIRQHFGVEE